MKNFIFLCCLLLSFNTFAGEKYFIPINKHFQKKYAGLADFKKVMLSGNETMNKCQLHAKVEDFVLQSVEFVLDKKSMELLPQSFKKKAVFTLEYQDPSKVFNSNFQIHSQDGQDSMFYSGFEAIVTGKTRLRLLNNAESSLKGTVVSDWINLSCTSTKTEVTLHSLPEEEASYKEVKLVFEKGGTVSKVLLNNEFELVRPENIDIPISLGNNFFEIYEYDGSIWRKTIRVDEKTKEIKLIKDSSTYGKAMNYCNGNGYSPFKNIDLKLGKNALNELKYIHNLNKVTVKSGDQIIDGSGIFQINSNRTSVEVSDGYGQAYLLKKFDSNPRGFEVNVDATCSTFKLSGQKQYALKVFDGESKNAKEIGWIDYRVAPNWGIYVFYDNKTNKEYEVYGLLVGQEIKENRVKLALGPWGSEAWLETDNDLKSKIKAFSDVAALFADTRFYFLTGSDDKTISLTLAESENSLFYPVKTSPCQGTIKSKHVFKLALSNICPEMSVRNCSYFEIIEQTKECKTFISKIKK